MSEYNVVVPDSLKGKPKKSKPVKRPVPIEPKPEEVLKVAAPKVVLDSGRRRVRLRGANYALPCCISSKDREIRVTLQPNKWTEVPEEIYQMLKAKFGQVHEREVPDWRDGDNPERTPRMEAQNAPIIEGL